MQLSGLQRYILKKTYIHGPRCSRSMFVSFYRKHGKHEAEIITKSIERLITKQLLIGYGKRTAEKWFIDSVSLTPRARKIVLQIVRQQQRLPLK